MSAPFRGLIAVILIMAAACATTQTKNTTTRKPSPETLEKAGDRDILRPSKELALHHPRQNASYTILEQGRAFLRDGDLERARKSFQDAIAIDPMNGAAYFYLALARYQLQEYQEALGILEKAEGLLSANEEWIEQIGELRDMINEAKP